MRGIRLLALLCVTLVQGQCPSIPPGGCSICGAEQCVQNPEGIFTFPGQREFLNVTSTNVITAFRYARLTRPFHSLAATIPCGTLQDAGYQGLIPLDQCPILVTVIGVCNCGLPG